MDVLLSTFRRKVRVIKYFAERIDELDRKYWGTAETQAYAQEISENDIVKIAMIDKEVIGVVHLKPIGDLLDCYHILIDEEY